MLGVEQHNEGTRALGGRWFAERIGEEGARKRRESLKSPERAAKIGAVQRGKLAMKKMNVALGLRVLSANDDMREKPVQNQGQGGMMEVRILAH